MRADALSAGREGSDELFWRIMGERRTYLQLVPLAGTGALPPRRSTSVVETYAPSNAPHELLHANVSGEGLGHSCQELNVRRSCQATSLDIRASATRLPKGG